VRSLRRERRREEATAIAALRRPGWDDWALNAVAASQPEVVEAFAAAAADVREAQAAAIEGRDGPDIRAALRDLRERSAELVRLAEDALAAAGRQPAVSELTARLTATATNEVAVAQLRVGVLGSGDTSPKDLFGDVEPAASPPRRTRRAAGTAATEHRPEKTRATTKKRGTRGERRDAEATRRAREERAERARREAALEEAQRRHAAAIEARERAAADAAAARDALARARAAVAHAEAAVAAAERELAAADEAVAAATRRVDDARLALEGSG